MKIACLDLGSLGADLNTSAIKSIGEVSIYNATDSSLVIERLFDIEVAVINKIVLGRDLLNKLPSLKLICITATGMDNVDLEACDDLGIQVKNVKGYSTQSVVQHTFSMLFYLLSNSKYFDEYTSCKQWAKSEHFTHLGQPFTELSGKRWGIIGLGAIGSDVAKVASAFGVEIIYYSTSGLNKNDIYEKSTLENLLSTSDIISIHAPLNNKTKNLIGAKELSMIKDTAILLNLGRGPIINESDLADKLEQSDLRVGLDVLEVEPFCLDSSLERVVHLPNLFLTPHIAWASKEARDLLFKLTIKNILDYINS